MPWCDRRHPRRHRRHQLFEPFASHNERLFADIDAIDLEEVVRDQCHRRFRQDSRGELLPADPSLQPAEQLYLRAADLAEVDPDQAAALLQSLVDLYGPKGGGKADADLTAVVQLAEQRLKAMRADLTKLHERELTALHERLGVAEQLSKTEPQQAAAMYRAIIGLHQDNAWAKDVIAQARNRLEDLDKKYEQD